MPPGNPFYDDWGNSEREAAQEMVQKTGQMSIPVIIVGDEIVVGFDQPLLDKLLAD